MNSLRILVCVASLSLLSPVSAVAGICPVAIKEMVEIQGEDLRLADLLEPETCPALQQSALRVRLGGMPAWGSVRVLRGEEIRARLEEIRNSGVMTGWPDAIRVPERVRVLRAGVRASCPAIIERLLSGLPNPAESKVSGIHEVNCGAAGRIPQNAILQVPGVVRKGAAGDWELTARCVRSADCVPFLVRLSGSDGMKLPTWSAISPPGTSIADPVGGPPMVHRGEHVTLWWEQDGIRLVVPAISLEAGVRGEKIRARIAGGGRIVHAVVEKPGILRAAS